jgi:type VI secretion system protein VasD
MKDLLTHTIYFVSTLFIISSSGCSIIKNQGVDAHIDIITSDYINPDHNNESRPLNITLFYLTDESDFLHTEYYDLFQTEQTPLAATLIHKTNILVLPSQHKTYREAIPENVRAIGIVYQFRQLEQSKWLALVPTPESCFFGLNCRSILHNSNIFISIDELDTKTKVID